MRLSAVDLLFRGRTDIDRRAVEATLPAAYRGRRGYLRLLDDIPLRMSISGTRGKSSLILGAESELRARGHRTYAKQTGTDPVSIRDGVHHPIHRPTRGGALFDENIWEVKNWLQDGIDALLLENQAISGYTMRVFNEFFCRPHYVLITNIRRDHVEDLGDNLLQHPRAFGRSVPRGRTLVSGEVDEEIAYLLRRECESVGARFVDAAPHRSHVYPPGYESVTVLDSVLELATGRGLGESQLREEHERLRLRFAWSPSALPGVRWFHGAEINDVDSTRAIHQYLLGEEPLPTTFIAYFRPDRRGRTATFATFLAEGLREGWCKRAYLMGSGAEQVARRLQRWRSQVEVLPDQVESVPPLMERLAKDCVGEAVMTVANAVPPVARRLAQALTVAPN